MKIKSMIMVVIMMLCITINAQEQSNKPLVAYFSATGTTEKAAKLIVEVTGGTLYEIQPEKEYVTADLDWHNKSSRSSVEMSNAKSRPTLKSKPENLADYDIIYIGFPIWWNSAPRIINTFIEGDDFAGKVIIPFGDNSLALLRFKSKVPYFYLSLLMVIAVYLIVRAIDRSKFGYALKTVREDEDTANAIGINPLKYKVLATFVSCGLIAVCGVFYANYIRFINPDIMIQAQSVEFVLPAVIGGIGSVTGPLIGAIILTPLAQYLNSTLSSIAPGANLLVYAIILIVVILFQPRGIMGWYNGSKFKVKVNDMFDRMDGKK